MEGLRFGTVGVGVGHGEWWSRQGQGPGHEPAWATAGTGGRMGAGLYAEAQEVRAPCNGSEGNPLHNLQVCRRSVNRLGGDHASWCGNASGKPAFANV